MAKNRYRLPDRDGTYTPQVRAGSKPTPTPTPTPKPPKVPSSVEPFAGNWRYWLDGFINNTIFGKKKKGGKGTATPTATPHR